MAKKKRKKAVKKTPSIFSRLQRPLIIGVVAILLLGLRLMPHTTPVRHTEAPTEKVTAVTAPVPRQQSIPQSPPKTAATTAPTKSPPLPTTPKVVASAIPQSTKPEPVVIPSPGSSVSSLAPVATTPNSSSGGSSATTEPSPPPATTTGYTSTNWSGYIAGKGTFTAISGSWTVPTITGLSGVTSADAAWIGIGGASTNDLIQAGTQDTVSPSGQVTSQAFYELLPNSSVVIPSLTVTTGDHMSASLTEVSSGEWAITITDETNGETFTFDTAYASSNSSAEWIEEDPSYAFRRQIPFDYFGTVSFTDGTTTSNGADLSIAGSNAEPVTMLDVTGKNPVSTPSALSGGSFIVTRDE